VARIRVEISQRYVINRIGLITTTRRRHAYTDNSFKAVI
jgi:hypothetical protein